MDWQVFVMPWDSFIVFIQRLSLAPFFPLLLLCIFLLVCFCYYCLPLYALSSVFDLVWWEVCPLLFPQLWCEQGDWCAGARTHLEAGRWWAGRRKGFLHGCLFWVQAEKCVGMQLSSARFCDPLLHVLVNWFGNFFMSTFLLGLRNDDIWRIWNT